MWQWITCSSDDDNMHLCMYMHLTVVDNFHCACYQKDIITTLRTTKAWFPYDRPNRPSRLKKNVQMTGTIIWKRYPDDRKRPGRLRRPRSLG